MLVNISKCDENFFFYQFIEDSFEEFNKLQYDAISRLEILNFNVITKF
jgi:hypothetical protein